MKASVAKFGVDIGIVLILVLMSHSLRAEDAGASLSGLSITHKLSSDNRSEFNVSQAGQTSPHYLVPRWWIVRAS